MERRGLGRGLASLIPAISREEVSEKVAVQPEGPGTMLIKVQEIEVNPFQPRKGFDEKKIGELADSIREKGILVPLIVSSQNGRYQLISGERRLRAAKSLGLSEVPALVRGGEDSERLEIALVENIQREDLNPLEEARAYELLMSQFGYTQEEVAKRVGKDRATVANLLRLLRLPEKIQGELVNGGLTMGHARALLGVNEIERQLYFTQRVVEEGWSVRELEMRIAARRMIGLKSRIRNLRPLPPDVIGVVEEIRRTLGTQVRLIPSGKKGLDGGRAGKILIEYYSQDDLERIHQLIVGKG